MSVLWLLLSMALAEPPAEALTALGLDSPTTSTRTPGWRSALPQGGLVHAIESDDEKTAREHFAWQKQIAQAGVWPDAPTELIEALGVDEAAGDGAASLLVRKGTVVLYVRDLDDDAKGWVERILPLL